MFSPTIFSVARTLTFPSVPVFMLSRCECVAATPRLAVSAAALVLPSLRANALTSVCPVALNSRSEAQEPGPTLRH